MMRRGLIAGAAALAAGGAGWFGLSRLMRPQTLDDAAFAARFAAPPPAPSGPLSVYHLGHSLVGRDMPVMLAQLADAAFGPGHRHASQLGWGASLKEHWEGPAALRGFDTENAHPRHRPAPEALASGEYDAVVMTEMVELRDAIRWHDSARHLALWAGRALAARPDVRLYLYTTWHRLDDAGGFLPRIDADQDALWVGQVLRPALARLPGATIRVIPGGPVLAAVTRAVEAQGGLPGLADRTALFHREPDGTQDTIHLSPVGLYLIALTHFAVLYQRNPAGLPHALRRADGAPADAPSAPAAALMQAVVWDVVRADPLTGVATAAA